MTFKGEPQKVVNEISKKTIFVALIPLISALVTGDFSVVIGILYGLVISVLLFRLKYLHIQKALEMDVERASSYIRNRYFFNYAIYFSVLLTAYRSLKVNLIAVVIGLLLLKFVIIALAVIDILKEKWNNKLRSLNEGRY